METENVNIKNWKSLIKPSKIDVQMSDDLSKAKIVAEPLEKGYGLTLGNSLRRILLSSIRGAAVTSIQIDGVLHEFTSIKGVREDVTDIVLNVKSLALKSSSEGTKKLILDAKGPGEIKASDITPVADVEILNPELVICNLDENTSFHMEMNVNTGKGYVPAELNKPEEPPLGLIAIDSLYSPVKKVSYSVSTAREGKALDYDKLTMEVETDGSISAEDAVAYSARIFQDQLKMFINFDEPVEAPVKEVQIPNIPTDDQNIDVFADAVARHHEEPLAGITVVSTLPAASPRIFFPEITHSGTPRRVHTKVDDKRGHLFIQSTSMAESLMPCFRLDLVDAKGARRDEVVTAAPTESEESAKGKRKSKGHKKSKSGRKKH